MTERAHVPCGSCHRCCDRELIVLQPDHGDQVKSYEHEIKNGLPVLKRGADGRCCYLRDGKCTIWNRAPFVCRIFDCRMWFLSHTQPQRQALVRAGTGTADVFEAGKARVASLTKQERAEALRIRELRK